MRGHNLWIYVMAVAAGIALLYLGIGRIGSTAALLSDQELSTGNLIRAWVSSSLVLDLEFGEGGGTTAYDSSPYHSDGTIFGASWTSNPPYVGCALDFDGIDDYVQVSDSESLNPAGAITVEGWIYVSSWDDSINDPGWPRLLQRESAYRAFVHAWGMNFGVWDNVGALFEAGGGPPGGMALDTWFHFCGTAERDGRVKLYYDGVEIADVAGPSNAFGAATDVLRIASDLQGRKVDGIIDRVRIYNRALSPTEVKQSYDESVSHYIP